MDPTYDDSRRRENKLSSGSELQTTVSNKRRTWNDVENRDNGFINSEFCMHNTQQSNPSTASDRNANRARTVRFAEQAQTDDGAASRMDGFN